MSATAAAVAFLIGVLGTWWFLKTSGKPAPPPALSDKINWLSTPFPGVVMLKDGGFMVGWRVNGPDPSSVSVSEINRVAGRVNDALLPFTEGWCFHTDLYRTPSVSYAPRGAFPDRVSFLIDEERRKAYQTLGRRFESETYLTATYLPPPEMKGKFDAMFQRGTTKQLAWDREFDAFRRSLLDLSDRLAGVVQLERLDTTELLSHCYRALTGRRQRVAVPFHGSYIDTVLCHEPFVGDFKPRLGNTHIRVVSINGYPEEVYPTILDALGELAFEYRWSTRFIPIAPPVADNMIRKLQTGHFEGRKGGAAWMAEIARKDDKAKNPELDAMQEDPHARAVAKSASEAIGLNASGKARYCHLNVCVVIHRASEEKADEDARAVARVLRDAMFTSHVELMHAAEAFWGSLPGHGQPNLRRPLVSTQNIAALLPVRSVWPGPKRNPCQYYSANSPPLFWSDTAGSTPFRVCLHSAGDVGHTLLVGQTGGGKSTILQLITAQAMRYPDAQVFFFDKGRSAELLCKSMGGSHLTLRPGDVDGLTLQPLARCDDPVERGWLIEWLGVLIGMQGLSVTPLRGEVLGRSLLRLGNDAPQYRTMTQLMMQVAAEDKEMGAALKVYTGAGPYGRLLDGDLDEMDTSSLTVFEMHHLMDAGDAIAVPTLFLLLHRLDGRFNAGRPTYLIVDEAASALGHPYFEKKMKEYAVTLRKRNVVLVLAFQTLAQLHELSSRTVLVDSCPTKIFLPNPEAESERNLVMYQDIGLSSKEIRMLKESTPTRDYYFKGPTGYGSRLFQLNLGSVAKAFFFARPGMVSEATLDHAGELEARHGRAWPAVWLEEAGLHEAAARYRKREEIRDETAFDEVGGRGAGAGRAVAVVT